MQNQKKHVAGDFLLNLVASFLSTGVLQIVLYPFLAQYLATEQYGIVLTIMGVGNTLTNSFGGSLNNVRLLQNTTYINQNQQGDFSFLFATICVLSAVSYGCYLVAGSNVPPLTIFLLVLFVVMATMRRYAAVAFRVVINYTKNLILNAVVGVAQIAGIGVLYLSANQALWPIPFLVGELAGVGYLMVSSDIFREPLRFTPLAWQTCKKTIVLFVTTFIENLILYLDRLLLLPILGGEAVSVYTVASFFGKSLGVLVTPLSGVLLSYYAQKDFGMTRRGYWKLNISMIAFSLVFFLFCVVAGPFGTSLFYPTLIDEARPYILLANFAAVINVTSSMVQPAVLRFAPTRWQLIIELLYGTIYLSVGCLAAVRYGLQGFCMSAIVAAMTKLVILLAAGHWGLKYSGRRS